MQDELAGPCRPATTCCVTAMQILQMVGNDLSINVFGGLWLVVSTPR
jgi:hypothetical protein